MRVIPISLPILFFAALLHAQTGDTGPALIERHEPEYSVEAARARVQSVVVLNITIGVDGKAHDVRVGTGAGFGLDEKAIEIIGTWVFQPATKDGKPVPYPANIELNFNMRVKDPEDHTGQLSRLNFTLPEGATRPELIVGKLPGNPAAGGDQSVKFHLQVDAQGVPKNVTGLSATDQVWEKQVLRVVQTWRFRPATVNGSAVAVEGDFLMAHAGDAEEPAIQVSLHGPDEEEEKTLIRRYPMALPVPGLTARANHTATRLPNGTVLLAGGSASEHEVPIAQTFDWATRRIANTAHLIAARQLHSATLLTNGTVLIAGGLSDGHTLATAEIFDASTGQFSAAGNLRKARSSHAAALLTDGRVLICGGTEDPAGAEIYDPTAKTFTPTGRMTAARASLHAITLKDGRVLIVGGAGATAEVFDPKTGKFSAVGSMTSPRAAFSATLLQSGQVLIVGGSDGTAGENLASAELFDPVTNTFHATGSLTRGHAHHTATLLNNGKVLIAGGSDSPRAEPLTQTEVYDPESGTFSAGPLLTGLHFGHTATLLEDGSVLIAGSSEPDSGSSAELLTIN
jgi:TonB family protein